MSPGDAGDQIGVSPGHVHVMLAERARAAARRASSSRSPGDDPGEICITTARALSLVTGFNPETIRHLVEACEQICRICADECASHGDGMEQGKRCSETCRVCADACRSFLQELQAA